MFSVIKQECQYHRMKTSAIEVVKSMPLSYMNLKIKFKCFLEQHSSVTEVIILLFEKIRQSEAVTGTAILAEQKLGQTAIGVYITDTLEKYLSTLWKGIKKQLSKRCISNTVHSET